MADLPISLDGPAAEVLARSVDPEGKIPRALEALGPVAGRDVLALAPAGGLRVGQLEALGARVRAADSLAAAADGAGTDGAFDAIVGFWTSFRGPDPEDISLADRLLRPGGRLLAVHDYGRDDVSRLHGDRPEYGAWSRRGGPFLGDGFRVRVLHCWWTFESTEAARDVLETAFGVAGATFASGLKRPRLSYNVAIYHRSRPDGPPEPGAGQDHGGAEDAAGRAYNAGR